MSVVSTQSTWGVVTEQDKTKMKAFVLAALAGLAAAALSPDVSSHVVSHGHGAVVAHGSHAAHGAVPVLAHPFAHAVAHPVAHAFAHPAAHAVAHPVAHAFAHPVAHAVAHPAVAVAPLHHAVHAAPLAHAVHAAPVIAHHAPVAHAVHAAPVIAHAAPAYAAPVVAPPAYHQPAYKETPEPYAYTYGVSDDYSKANFNAAETSDANGVVSGSYTVALPDGRIQKVSYTADHVNGYVADVTYDGVPVYPEAKPYVPAPAPAYHA